MGPWTLPLSTAEELNHDSPDTPPAAVGSFTLRSKAKSARISMCHCLACQRRTGAVSGNQARFRREQVTFTGKTADPEAVLAYLSRYTHRVAIANSRLISVRRCRRHVQMEGLSRKGPERAKVMTLATGEFIRRFLIHVLPGGFHRIRHYGLFASSKRAENIARARQLLAVPQPQSQNAAQPLTATSRKLPRIHARAAAAA